MFDVMVEDDAGGIGPKEAVKSRGRSGLKAEVGGRRALAASSVTEAVQVSKQCRVCGYDSMATQRLRKGRGGDVAEGGSSGNGMANNCRVVA